MPTENSDSLTALLPALLLPLSGNLNVAKGTRLFAAGDKPADMFFVIQGEVVLERPGLNGSLVVLQRTRHGFVGEASLKSERYHCDGRAVAATRLVRIPVQAMQTAMDTDAAFSGRWINMLNKELKRLRLQCERLALPKLQDRLVHLIETEGEGGQYAIGAGIKAMSADLGVTHEALYRCVSAMEKLGRIRRSQHHIGLVARQAEPGR